MTLTIEEETILKLIANEKIEEEMLKSKQDLFYAAREIALKEVQDLWSAKESADYNIDFIPK